MKRFPLSRQITLIFIASFTVTNLLIAIQVARTIKEVYREQIYDMLDAEAKAVCLWTLGRIHSRAPYGLYLLCA